MSRVTRVALSAIAILIWIGGAYAWYAVLPRRQATPPCPMTKETDPHGNEFSCLGLCSKDGNEEKCNTEAEIFGFLVRYYCACGEDSPIWPCCQVVYWAGYEQMWFSAFGSCTLLECESEGHCYYFESWSGPRAECWSETPPGY